ncbi:MAG: capsule biosynthesis protein CapK [Ruminococcaceae bacterium]|nr:capsule biosynthesis protein CapK [Oscillospiraceae bacterium]
MDSRFQIDIVVPWVDDTDPVWRKKKAEYTGVAEIEGNSDVRYRDWDTLKYWFRSVEKFAPWVRYVFFVTDNQKPEWLNMEHPKLKWIKHTDYIPKEYLPTFNSSVILWNLNRISELSEHFILFNDDVFLIDKTEPEDFFVDGKPCDLPDIGPLYPEGFFSHLVFNNICLINRHFSLKESIKKNKKLWTAKQGIAGRLKLLLYGRKDLLPGSTAYHIQNSYKKSTFDKLWQNEYDVIHQTCLNKVRTVTDVTTWSVRDWRLLEGDFYPKKPIGRNFHTYTMKYSNEAIEYLKNRKGKTICLNDTEDETDFEVHKKMIIDEFEKIFPEKSSFEF